MRSPLSAAGEERVVERSKDRVSKPGGHYRQCIAASRLTPTIPYVRDWSTLSSASGKEGEKLMECRDNEY